MLFAFGLILGAEAVAQIPGQLAEDFVAGTAPGSAEVTRLEAAPLEAEISKLPQTSPVRAEAQARLWEAAGTGNLADAKAALEAGADLNALDTRTNQNGRTALNYAAEKNQAAMIQWLIDRGAEVNRANNTGFTPLHHAAESGSPAAAEMLLKLGAALKATNRRGETPLAVAKRRGMTEVAAMLEKAGGK